MSLLELDQLSVSYRQTARAAVHRVDLEVHEGETLAIVGESGSGKSSLALACLRLLDDDVTVTGAVRLDGRDLRSLSRRQMRAVRGAELGFVYQNALSAFSPLWTVGEQIAETVRAHTDASKAESWRQTVAQLDDMRVRDPERVARSYPHELSGGQCQRAALAMALVLRPRILIADEPTSALDVTTGAHLLALLKRLQSELSLTIILITHDMRVVQATADRVAVMYGGVLGEVAPAETVFNAPRYPYTKALIESLALDRPRGQLSGVAGAPPGLSEEIPGCPFAARCPRAKAVCSDVPPEPRDVAGSTVRCYFPHVPTAEASDVHLHR